MPNYRLDGTNPLGYMGVRPYTPPQMIVRKTSPTQHDFQGLTLGTLWTYYIPSNPTQSVVYCLVSVAEGVATWIPLNGGGDQPTLPEYQVALGTGVPGLTSVGSLGTTGQALTSQGAGMPPLWENIPDLPTITQYQVLLGIGAPGYSSVGSLGTTGQILTSQGAGMAPLWTGSGGAGGIGSINVIVLDTPGSGTYTPSAGMLQCVVECIGGGCGAEGIGISTDSSGSVLAAGAMSMGGSGGGYCKKTFTAADIGSSQPYTVGAAGAGGVSSIPARGSGPVLYPPSVFGGDTTFGTGPLLTAQGGQGRTVTSGNPYAIGGSATGGDINIQGESLVVPDATNGNFFNFGLNVMFTGSAGSSGGGYGIGAMPSLISYSYSNSTLNIFTQGQSAGSGYGNGSSSPFGVCVAPSPGFEEGNIDGLPGNPGVIIITEYIAS